MAGRRDLVVIGGGPAGAAAAIHARQAGLDVLLLESGGQSAPAPGETLHPGVEPILDRLGVGDSVRAAGFHRHSGVFVSWDGARRFDAYGSDEAGPWRGFQAERRVLREILLDAAASCGVEVRREGVAHAPVMRDGHVVGIEAGGRATPARWTIDASGRRSWLARSLRLPAIVRSPPVFAAFGWTGTGRAGGGEPELCATPDGWRWTAPLGGSRSAWVEAVVDPPRMRRGLGADLTWHMRDCAAPGHFLAGDAAVTLDPCSSHGVLRAMLTGIMCADLAAEEIAGKISAREAAERYRGWLAAWFDAEVEALAGLYLRHPAPRVARAFARYFPRPAMPNTVKPA
ncbi:MAG: hypothetical protein QOG13_1113 [Sphingomonadales bacterium]|jgi:flavin-dependent dehydrogenase|nr:hypothetical protein [Sphingomonadales bacterium]